MMRRRTLLASSLLALTPSSALAFGEEGAFHTRLLGPLSGKRDQDEKWKLLGSAMSRWSFELMERTSAPVRIATTVVSPESKELFEEPFIIWTGAEDPGTLSRLAARRLSEFFRLGGFMLVDDQAPETGAFRLGVERELEKVALPSPRIKLPPEHVLFKSFYLIPRPVGRVIGPPTVEASLGVAGSGVLFLRHDLLGALARRGDTWASPLEPDDPEQRELAIRFAINIAMYILCTDYKDDQVHAPYLMRRRTRSAPTRPR